MATFNEQGLKVKQPNTGSGPSRMTVLVVVPILVALVGLAGVLISDYVKSSNTPTQAPGTTNVQQEVQDNATGIIHTGDGDINVNEDKGDN